ncbi:MAG: hypothetical protein ACJ74Z_20965 [Bryobacteraceae bacterium]
MSSDVGTVAAIALSGRGAKNETRLSHSAIAQTFGEAVFQARDDPFNPDTVELFYVVEVKHGYRSLPVRIGREWMWFSAATR